MPNLLVAWEYFFSLSFYLKESALIPLSYALRFSTFFLLLSSTFQRVHKIYQRVHKIYLSRPLFS